MRLATVLAPMWSRGLALLAISLSGTAARADPPTRRVLVASFAGAPDAAALGRVMASVIREAGGTRVESAPLDDVLALTGCGEPTGECLMHGLGLLDVDLLVVGAVEPDGPGKVRVALRLFEKSAPERRRSFVLAAAALESGFRRAAASFWRDPDAAQAPISLPRPARAKTRKREPDGSAYRAVAGPAGFSAGRVSRLSWSLAGGGVGLAIAGGAFLLVAADEQRQIQDAPTGTVSDLDRLADLEANGRRHAAWGTAFLVVGSVAAAAGALLVFAEATDRGQGRRSIALVPSFAPGGVGAVLTVRGAP